VVGDAEDVETVPPVQVYELCERERTVAPRRVRVQLAEKRLDLLVNLPRLCPWRAMRGLRGGDDAGAGR
jgi:hypothetical protein